MTNGTRRFGLVLPKATKDILRLLAARRETTMTEIVLKAVNEYLEREAGLAGQRGPEHEAAYQERLARVKAHREVPVG